MNFLLIISEWYGKVVCKSGTVNVFLILFRRAASAFDGEDELMTAQTARAPQNPA